MMHTQDWIVVPITGSDAVDFLHRRSTQAITAASLRAGCIAHFLTPEGKVLHTIGLMTDKGGNVYAEMHANRYGDFVTDIAKHTFTEDIHIHPPIPYAWVSQAWEFPSAIFQAIGIGYVCGSHPGAIAHITSDRIRAKIPVFPIDYPLLTPAMDSDVMVAIDFDKGCYPGQEVISKTVNLGKAPYRLYWFCGNPETVRTITEKYGGAVTSCYPLPEGTMGFVRLRKTFDIACLSETPDVIVTPHAFSLKKI